MTPAVRDASTASATVYMTAPQGEPPNEQLTRRSIREPHRAEFGQRTQ